MKNIIFSLIAAFSYSVATMTTKCPIWMASILIVVICYCNCMYIKKRRIWRQQLIIGLFSIVVTTTIVYVLMKNISNIWIMAIATAMISTVLILTLNLAVPAIAKTSVDKRYDTYRKLFVTIINTPGIYKAMFYITNSKFVPALVSSLLVIVMIFGKKEKNTIKLKLTAAALAIIFGTALNCYGTSFPWVIGIAPVIEIAIYKLCISCYIKPYSKSKEPSSKSSISMQENNNFVSTKATKVKIKKVTKPKFKSKS